MWNEPTEIQLSKIPKPYAQEKKKDKKVYMKFFLGGWTWYVMEFDGKDNFFGLVVSPMETNGELGYFSLSELKSIKQGFMEVDRDVYDITPYKPVLLSKIRNAESSELTGSRY